METFAYVYILSGNSKCLYIGLTTKLEKRISEHKDHVFPESFSARYNIKRLVYFERYSDIQVAIAREKQLKRWSRIKKVALIVGSNPAWRDLSAEWGTPVEPFSGELHKPEAF
ncbi:GIY-YIG nuclease family protein [Granulicella sp. L46]|jgi:putative endonuclease|uniref:GIY-YIG nuclease family protein n=1 Tax=Granulicella sp. L46 TaxID=1641865 RepID=UPI00131C7D01|nr:GIY-YIG nuclease family protein [Granulicella sp. L46]